MKASLLLFIIFPFCINFCFSQKDTTRGTIKVMRPKETEAALYVMATMTFGNFDLSEIKEKNVIVERQVPSPNIGDKQPFNYTNYFNKQLQSDPVELSDSLFSDTVVIIVKVLPNGKVYLRDKSSSKMLNGTAAFYDPNLQVYKVNNFHLYAAKVLKTIKWNPGYVVQTKRKRIKGKEAIAPYNTKVPVSGLITIIFSSSPFVE